MPIGRSEQPLELTAIEYQARLPGGWSRPLLMLAEGNHGIRYRVVMKVRTPDLPYGRGHRGATSLACELACSILARALGLNVPDYAIVDVPSGLDLTVGDPDVQRILRDNVGQNFATVYLDGAYAWDVRAAGTNAPELAELEDILSFDASVYNEDRTASKTNLLWYRDKLVLIDHSLAIHVHVRPLAEIQNCPVYPPDAILKHCSYTPLRGRGHKFSRVGDTWTAELSRTDLDAMLAMIPPAWQHQPDHLDRISAFLDVQSGRHSTTSAALRAVVQ